MALEIMEQLDWQVPDYIAISVGDGCTIAGLWKGLKDLLRHRLHRPTAPADLRPGGGLLPPEPGHRRPSEPWHPMEENTLADSIAVGVPRNADKALMAIRESDGLAVNVSDQEIMAAQKLLGRTCGVFGEPAGVTGAAGVKKLCEQGEIWARTTRWSAWSPATASRTWPTPLRPRREPISIPSDMDRLLAAFAEKGITVE